MSHSIMPAILGERICRALGVPRVEMVREIRLVLNARDGAPFIEVVRFGCDGPADCPRRETLHVHDASVGAATVTERIPASYGELNDIGQLLADLRPSPHIDA